MKAINIYALTRLSRPADVSRMERQLSAREFPLKVRGWEMKSLEELCAHLCNMKNGSDLTFYYSFQIPKLGKEFDLLRVSDETVINVELKSNNVSDEKIKAQLEQNRYYLSTLGRNIRSYTYISSTDRLVRLTNSGNLIESDWDQLEQDLSNQTECNMGDIEDLFLEENYIISPLSDPDRFLRREYFLTSQQKDIRKSVLKAISEGTTLFQGFTGLPGTGKTLLLYELAMQLSKRDRVCVLHFGSFPMELKLLDERLKRIDFFECRHKAVLPDMDNYTYILVDEGHRISEDVLTQLVEYSSEKRKAVVFSYDNEDAISPEELTKDMARSIEALSGFRGYRLTNRIRMNGELSSFIRNMMHFTYPHNRKYPSVRIYHAGDMNEAQILMDSLGRENFVYIRNHDIDDIICTNCFEKDASAATCREFEKVVMMINEAFRYDNKGYLRADGIADGVRRLYHGLNRAKSELAIICVSNEDVLDTLLTIVQGK